MLGQGLGSAVGQHGVVLIGRLGRSVSVNLDARYLYVLVGLDKVYSVDNLGQLGRIVAVFGIERGLVHGKVNEGAALLGACLARLGSRANVGDVGFAHALYHRLALLLDVAASAKVFGYDDVGVLHPVLVGQRSVIAEALLRAVGAAHGARVVRKILAGVALVRNVLLAAVDHDHGQQAALPVERAHRGCEHQALVGAQAQRVHVEGETDNEIVARLFHRLVFNDDGVAGQFLGAYLRRQCERHGQQGRHI